MARKRKIDVTSAAQELGKRGGEARAKALSANERKEIASNAAKARWGRQKEQKG
jgi:hypothetical protein